MISKIVIPKYKNKMDGMTILYIGIIRRNEKLLFPHSK